MKVMVSVYDKSAECFGTPFFAQSSGAAVRSFTDEVNRVAEDNILYKHPVDFSLHRIAVFNEQTGELEEVKREKLVDAAAVVINK